MCALALQAGASPTAASHSARTCRWAPSRSANTCLPSGRPRRAYLSVRMFASAFTFNMDPGDCSSVTWLLSFCFSKLHRAYNPGSGALLRACEPEQIRVRYACLYWRNPTQGLAALRRCAGQCCCWAPAWAARRRWTLRWRTPRRSPRSGRAPGRRGVPQLGEVCSDVSPCWAAWMRECFGPAARGTPVPYYYVTIMLDVLQG